MNNARRKVESLFRRAQKYSKGDNAQEIAIKYARAYAKQTQTLKTAENWIAALQEVEASPEIVDLFVNRAVELGLNEEDTQLSLLEGEA